MEKVVEVEAKPPSPSRKIDFSPILSTFSTKNTQFGNYISQTRDKICTYLERQKISKAKRPFNILLSAPPGKGKSFLARELAESAAEKAGSPFEFDEVYVSALSELDEINDVFRRCQSISLDGKVPVVLFDEIDSKVGGLHLYNRFLSPMWDGKFFIGNQKNSLPPSVFFFAGSTISRECLSRKALEMCDKPIMYADYKRRWDHLFEESLASVDGPEKISDFVDRIDEVIRIPPTLGLLSEKDAQEEFEMMACILIKKHHRVKIVREAVLKALANTIKEKSLRAAEKVVFISSPDDSYFDSSHAQSDFQAEIEKFSDSREFVEI